MNGRTSVAPSLALVLLPLAIHAQQAQIHGREDAQAGQVAEEPWPMESTGDVSLLVVRERYRIYVEHCGQELPILKAALDEEMKSLQKRIRAIGMRLLDSDAFNDMKRQQVAPTLRSALSAELADIRLELEQLDPAQVCPETLRSYGATTDEVLQDFLRRTLAGIRSTARMLKSGNAP
jgi:hypothetical protein